MLAISLILLILGSIYTVSNKIYLSYGRKTQSMQFVEDKYGNRVQFSSPIFQTFCLFFGQFICLIIKSLRDIFNTKKAYSKKVKSTGHYYAFFPAIFDVLATILDTIGLFYTHVSVSQMLKAFLIVFTYIISKFFFKRNISTNQCCGIVFVFVGVGLVGISNINEHTEIVAQNPLLGNTLCILAQVFIAMMFIAEETIMKDKKIGALSLVGWEGFWGSLVTALFLSLLLYHPLSNSYFQEDFTLTAQQVFQNDKLFTALAMSALTIGYFVANIIVGPFNYLGSRITKISSALHRSALDSLRMLCVWCFSLSQAWEEFRIMQAFGFSLLTIGVLLIAYYKSIEPEQTIQEVVRDKTKYEIIDDVDNI